MEAHYQQQIEGWRRELDSKHGQFEEARAQIMQPRELEKLRKQLMEELETPTREKLQAYERDVEESNDKYMQAVRDMETLRTQHDIEVARLLKENEYQKMDHAQELAMIRKESEMAEEDVRVKSRQIESLQDEVRDHLQVKANNAALGADNEAQRQMRQEAVIAAEKAEVGLKNRILITDKLERRISNLQAEVEECNADISRLHAKLDQAEVTKIKMHRRLEEEQFKHRSDVKRAHAEAAKERAELEAEFAIEREEANEKEQAILSQLATHDASIQQIQDNCDARIHAAEDSARSARRSAEASKIEAEVKLDAALTDLAASKSDMLKAVGEAEGLRAALAVLEREYEHEVPALRRDLEQFKKVCARVLLNNSILFFCSYLCLRSPAIDIYFWLLQDLVHEQLRLSDVKQTLEQERAERLEVGATMVERDREVRRLTAELEEKDLNHGRDMAALKKAWQREKTLLIVRAKEIAAASEERHRESVRKAKRKLEGQQRKIAALSMDKVTLLEEGRSVMASSDEQAEEEAGGTVLSVFEEEFASLNDRQLEYAISIKK